MSDRLISPNFSLRELTRTQHREHQIENRVVPAHLLAAAHALAWGLLEPIRAHFGQPVIVHSGYRYPALNRAVGGSEHSQHMRFEAADFEISGVSLEAVWSWIWKESLLHFGQVILEDGDGGGADWVHVSLGVPFRERERCGQALTFVKGSYATKGQARWIS